ncbi:hypothetical protein HDU83_002193 [Entophlyctis luteolus]|nr:hypothetical protein HDU83_002193 [Entophlyctis luteolus]
MKSLIASKISAFFISAILVLFVVVVVSSLTWDLGGPPVSTNDNFESTHAEMAHLLCSASRAPHPKVAACIAGNARTLKYPLVYKTIKSFALDSLGGDVSLFGFLKLEDPSQEGHEFWPVPETNTRADIAPALQHLGFQKVVIRDTSNETYPKNPNCPFDEMSWLHKPEPHNRFIGQYNSLRECFKLVEDYESENDMKFDIVLRIRPDAAWFSSLPPWCIYDLSKVFAPAGRHPDHFLLVPRKLADSVFKITDWYYNECNELRKEYNPEEILSTLVEKKSGHAIQRIEMNLNLVRGVGTEVKYNVCDFQAERFGIKELCDQMFNTQQDRSN